MFSFKWESTGEKKQVLLKLLEVNHFRWLILLITRVAQEETPPLRLTVPFRVFISPDEGCAKLET